MQAAALRPKLSKRRKPSFYGEETLGSGMQRLVQEAVPWVAPRWNSDGHHYHRTSIAGRAGVSQHSPHSTPTLVTKTTACCATVAASTLLHVRPVPSADVLVPCFEAVHAILRQVEESKSYTNFCQRGKSPPKTGRLSHSSHLSAVVRLTVLPTSGRKHSTTWNRIPSRNLNCAHRSVTSAHRRPSTGPTGWPYVQWVVRRSKERIRGLSRRDRVQSRGAMAGRLASRTTVPYTTVRDSGVGWSSGYGDGRLKYAYG